MGVLCIWGSTMRFWGLIFLALLLGQSGCSGASLGGGAGAVVGASGAGLSEDASQLTGTVTGSGILTSLQFRAEGLQEGSFGKFINILKNTTPSEQCGMEAIHSVQACPGGGTLTIDSECTETVGGDGNCFLTLNIIATFDNCIFDDSVMNGTLSGLAQVVVPGCDYANGSAEVAIKLTGNVTVGPVTISQMIATIQYARQPTTGKLQIDSFLISATTAVGELLCAGDVTASRQDRLEMQEIIRQYFLGKTG